MEKTTENNIETAMVDTKDVKPFTRVLPSEEELNEIDSPIAGIVKQYTNAFIAIRDTTDNDSNLYFVIRPDFQINTLVDKHYVRTIKDQEGHITDEMRYIHTHNPEYITGTERENTKKHITNMLAKRWFLKSDQLDYFENLLIFGPEGIHSFFLCNEENYLKYAEYLSLIPTAKKSLRKNGQIIVHSKNPQNTYESPHSFSLFRYNEQRLEAIEELAKLIHDNYTKYFENEEFEDPIPF
jgi:hypothetical protein